MPEYSHKMFFLAIVYIISLLMGASFILRATDLYLFSEFWLFAVVIFLPLVFLAMYHYHARFPSLWPYKNAIRILAIVSMLASAVFVIVVIAPFLLLV